MATTATMTEEQFETLARAICLGTQGYDDDWAEMELDDSFSCVSTTRDTLDDFREGARTVWAEAAGREEFEVNGCPCVHWSNVQAAKGRARVSLTVVDFGDFRACYSV